MSILRTAGRLAALVPLTAAFYLFLLLSLAVRRLARAGGARYGDLPWKAAILRRWSRSVCALLGVRFQVTGTPPSPPFLLVSNHLGYLDVIVLASRMPCVFVARADAAGWPVIGALCRSVGTIFIDRSDRRQLPGLVELVGSTPGPGSGVVFFPEGTSGDGSGVLPFRPALLEAAARTREPVHWAAISYETPPGAPLAREAVCWWRDMPFTGHFLALLGLPGIRARVVFGEEPVTQTDRKTLAERLEASVREVFVPVDTTKRGGAQEYRNDPHRARLTVQSPARGLTGRRTWKENHR